MEDLSEKEQLDALRAWWAENGSYVMGGIFAGVIIIFGWNRWQTGIADTETSASVLYEDVMEAAARGNLDAAGEAAGRLFNGYQDSPYADQARLAMARMYMDNGRDQDAADVLRVLVDGGAHDEFALIGRLRLAKILLYQDKAQEVIDLIGDMPETAFTARFNEVLGDAYVALESWADAEAAYMAALADSPQVPTVDTALIQLKINDLPVIDEADASETSLPEDAATEAAEPEEAESGDSADQAAAEADGDGSGEN